MEDKIYTTDELVEAGIYTTDFDFMDKPGEYIGTLLFKGSSYRGLLRLFFLLEDGQVKWHTSHWKITKDAIREAVQG